MNLDTTRISLYSPDWDPYSSYGEKSAYLLYYLSEMGVHVNAMGATFEKGHTRLKYDQQSDAIHALIDKPILPTVGGLMLGYPTLRESYGALLNAGPIVAVTAWESTEFPDGWLENLRHENVKAVVVGSQWVADALKKAGLYKPVHVVPLGVSEVYGYYQRPARSVYRFLAFGDRYIRKGWDVAVRAFVQAFGDRDDVELIIKTRAGSQLVYPLGDGLMVWDGEHFIVDGKPAANVRVMREDMDTLYDLYCYTDCMVFPSRGEGFGIPPRQYAATGGPVIATQWWADDIKAWGYPIRYTMVPAWQGHEKFAGLGKWAEPDVDHLAQQMRHVENLERTNIRYARYLGKQVSRRAQKLYNWQTFTERVWAIWQEASGAQTLDEKRAARRARKNGGKRD